MRKEELVKKINSLFRIIGFLEGTSYLLLLFFAVPMKYLAGNIFFVKLLGMPHGILFIGYIILAFLIKPILGWKFNTFCIVLTASVVPFGTFYTDKKYLKN
jgi:integral membrane protein